MKWHHYAGLIFGVASFTWVFSGLLSMNPWDWSPGTSPSRQQRDAVAGGSLRVSAVTIDGLKRDVRPLGPAKEMEICQFDGTPFIVTGPAPVRFTPDALVDAARRAVPGAAIADVTWLDAYDAYYYDRDNALSLPVLRVRFADPQQTWLYLDPRRGVIAHTEVRLSRVNRWLYHGLHSLDFPFLYYRRPLWDIVVIILSAAGLVLSSTTLAAVARRLRRHYNRVIG
jgi:hypothetical protein